MKIGILTQPLENNYGGLLQAYALQKVLKGMGHEVLTIDRNINEVHILIRILSLIKRWIISFLFDNNTISRTWCTTKEKKIISQHTKRFIKENINTTKKINRLSNNTLLKKYGFEAYVVGSDQVWRPRYSPDITDYFMAFLDNNHANIKIIAYAASFGVDKWEFSSKETTQCSLFAKRFTAISVREDSAIKLCKEYLGVNATHVLDPTMLLDKGDYVALVEKDNVFESMGNLMTYILDDSYEKDTIIKRVADELNLTAFSVMANAKFEKVGKKHLNDCIFPPITEWIRGFMDAEYVITDSFHGTILSIIFNKPFIVIGNEKRGLTRFNSLLRTFDLENRLLNSINELASELINAPIDYDRVNQIRKQEQKKAIEFIINALEK